MIRECNGVECRKTETENIEKPSAVIFEFKKVENCKSKVQQPFRDETKIIKNVSSVCKLNETKKIKVWNLKRKLTKERKGTFQLSRQPYHDLDSCDGKYQFTAYGKVGRVRPVCNSRQRNESKWKEYEIFATSRHRFHADNIYGTLNLQFRQDLN